MPRSATTGVYARVVNSFSQPVFGTLIDPTDADAYFDDLDVGLNPANFAGPTNIIGALTLGKAGTTVGTLGFFNATSGSITLSPPTGALGTVTLTLPDLTDTLVSKTSTDILSNKTFVAPVLGDATATTINKYTFTAPATAATLTILNNKTATFNNSITFAGTDATTMTFPTTTATLARTDAAQTFTGTQTLSGALVVNNTIAGGAITGTSTSANALAIGPTGVTNPAFNVDASTGSMVAGLNVKGAVTGGTVAISAIDSGANTSISINSRGTGSIALLSTGATTTVGIGGGGTSAGQLIIAGSSSGLLTILPPSVASGTLNLASGTLTGSSASAVWFDNIPQNSQSSAYGLVLADAQKHIYHPVGDNNPRTFTIPANASVAYPIGTAITFINEINTVTIAITTDTLILAGSGGGGSRTLAAAGVATAIKVTATRWIISGTGLT